MKDNAKPVKKLNRKKLIEELEYLRGGFAQVCMRAAETNDAVLLACVSAHHANANRAIVELGSAGVALPDYSQFMKPNAQADRPAKAKPKRGFGVAVQGIVRLFGGYTRDDLIEACKVAVGSYKAGQEGADAVDVKSWHYTKFGRSL